MPRGRKRPECQQQWRGGRVVAPPHAASSDATTAPACKRLCRPAHVQHLQQQQQCALRPALAAHSDASGRVQQPAGSCVPAGGGGGGGCHSDLDQFSDKLCQQWFSEYTTADDPHQIGPDGMERFCEDIGVEPENVVMLVLAWTMNAVSMGFFTRQQWLCGMTLLRCDSVAAMRTRVLDHLRSLLHKSDTFKSIYRFAFDFARDKSQRCVDMPTGRAMMQLLLGRQWACFSQFNAFLEHNTGRLRVINRDQWLNVLEFSRTVTTPHCLADYDQHGAWPVMLDEFVEWLQQQDPSVPSSSSSQSYLSSPTSSSSSWSTARPV